MVLPAEQTDHYRRHGYVFKESAFGSAEIELLLYELRRVAQIDSPARVLADDGESLRIVYGIHQTSDIFAALSRDPRLLSPSIDLLAGPVYVHQSKITAKSIQGSAGWPWHQDIAFWRGRDGLPTPRVLSAVVFLNDVTDVNGPIFLIPGTHRTVLPTSEYCLLPEQISELCRDQQVVVPKGPAGSILFFSGALVHGSPTNITPYPRTLCFFTYNSIGNLPEPGQGPPEYLCSRDFEPLTPTSDDVLSSYLSDTTMSPDARTKPVVVSG